MKAIDKRMKTYLDFVNRYEELMNAARSIAPQDVPPAERTALEPNAPCALIFSPHPDDETITGGLPLRLRKEAGCRIVNAAVTLGSRRDRRDARKAELENACLLLGFDVVHPLETGLEHITPAARTEGLADWLDAVRRLSEILCRFHPSVVFLPHAHDGNSTHIGTHQLVMDALKTAPVTHCLLVETEYWQPMEQPNLLVESSTGDVAELIAALALHRGEVERNPYHLGLPAWMQDNVRRGAELLGGQGHRAPPFLFGTLYRLSRWENGGVSDALPRHPFIGRNDPVRWFAE